MLYLENFYTASPERAHKKKTNYYNYLLSKCIIIGLG